MYTFDVFNLDRSKWHSFVDFEQAKTFYIKNSEYIYFRVSASDTGEHIKTVTSIDQLNQLSFGKKREDTVTISTEDIVLDFGAAQPALDIFNLQTDYDYFKDEDDFWLSQLDKSRNDKDLVDTNLKTAAARNKPKLSDVPPVALFALGAAMSDGASKYGRFNWRETGSTSSVFYDAMIRHLTDWYNGENNADDSGVNHLGHIMASCAILLDSQLHNKLNDDRKGPGTSISRNPGSWKMVT